MGNQAGEERGLYLFPYAMHWRLVALGLKSCMALTHLGMNVKHRLRKSSAAQMDKESGQ